MSPAKTTTDSDRNRHIRSCLNPLLSSLRHRIDQHADVADLQFANPSTVSDLRAMLQQLAGNDYQDEDEQASVEDVGADEMEEDDASENEDYLSEDEHDYDFDEDGSVDEEQNEDNLMEDADNLMETSQRSDNQPRSVSVSSDDV